MKWLILLIIIAGIAGYFTRPDEAKMREAANALLSSPNNISQGVESLGASLAGERSYDNYYVAARYRVILNNDPVVTCYGAFTQVQCSRGASSSSSSGAHANP
ncbi:MAG: hypothetical protein WAU68_02285 [Vitreimonas sp.]